jgi:16S rRNA (cytosine967-C5)-methyltransferase
VGQGDPRRAPGGGTTIAGDARTVAYSVVRRSLDGGAYADRALDGEATRAGLDARQRAFASFLALGTVQHLRTLDAAIAAASERSVDRLERPLLHALRLGAYQLLFAGSVPDRAAVSETVELVRSVVGQRATGFANAVLRKVASDGPAWLDALPEDTPEAAGLRHSLPDWVCQLWFEAFGPRRALELCRAANVPARSVLRPNPLRAAPGEAEAALEAAGIPHEIDAATGAIIVTGPFDLAGSELYERGLVVAQSLSSIAVVEIVAAQEGERVLDLCAAPGGKTAGLAATRASVTAVESNPARAAALRGTLERLGAGAVEVIEGDGRAYEGAPFDAILVDAPCSGLGVLNGRPDSRWRRTPSDVEALAVLQTELLAHARELLAPAGRLVYAACTLSPDENERVPRAVGLLPLSERRLWPGPGADGFYVATLRP